LREAGEEVACLILLESSTPDAVKRLEGLYLGTGQAGGGPDREWMIIKGFLGELNGSFDPEILKGLTLETFRSQAAGDPDPGSRFDAILNALARQGSIRADDARELGRLFTVFKTNIKAMDAYRPRPLEIPLTLVRARGNTGGQVEDGTANGWAPLAGARLRIHEVPGDHHSVLRMPDLAPVAELIARILKPDQS
jgi:thioesterase domain-containing protein